MQGSAFLLLDFLFMAGRTSICTVPACPVQNRKLCVCQTFFEFWVWFFFFLTNKFYQINLLFRREKVVCSVLTWLPLTTLPVHVGVTLGRHAGIRKHRQATSKNHMRTWLSESCQFHVWLSRCLWALSLWLQGKFTTSTQSPVKKLGKAEWAKLCVTKTINCSYLFR